MPKTIAITFIIFHMGGCWACYDYFIFSMYVHMSSQFSCQGISSLHSSPILSSSCWTIPLSSIPRPVINFYSITLFDSFLYFISFDFIPFYFFLLSFPSITISHFPFQCQKPLLRITWISSRRVPTTIIVFSRRHWQRINI